MHPQQGWRQYVATVGAAAAVLASCGGDNREPPQPPAERYCHALCLRAWECDLVRSVTMCTDECVLQPGNLNSMNDRAATVLSECTAQADCNSLFGDDVFSVCLAEAERATEASDYARAFCIQDATAWFECGYFYSVDECAEDYKLWSDETLRAASECHTAETCDALEACQDAIFAAP
jgi:hypothetical protein